MAEMPFIAGTDAGGAPAGPDRNETLADADSAAERVVATEPSAGDAGGRDFLSENPEEPVEETADPLSPYTATPAYRQISESEEIYELIIKIRRKNDLLSEASLGFQKGFQSYMPMAEIGRLVKFAVELDLASGTIEGFFNAPENTYSLNAHTGVFTVGSESGTLPPGSVILKDQGHGIGDIYITPEALNQIWPLELALNFSELSLDITTKKPLPYERERERQEKYKNLAARDAFNRKNLNIQYIANDYKAFGLPAINLTNQLRWENENSQIRNSFSLAGRNDLLWASADYNANVELKKRDTPEFRNLRLRLTRQDYGTGALPLGLKMVQAGDIANRPSDFIDRTISGRGVFISSEPHRRPQNFDEITVEGTGPAGWEVELYRNRELLDFGSVDEAGIYRFENVPLNFGSNAIRIVLYGPLGQVEEYTEEYQIGGNMLSPGQTTFEASVIDANRDLIRVDDRNDRLPQGGSQVLRINRGLSHAVTAFGTYTGLPTEKGDRRYVTAGAHISALGGAGLVEAYKEIGGGRALDTRYANRFAGINYSMRSTFFSDFESEEVGFEGRAKTFEGQFRASRSFSLPDLGRLALTVDALHTRHADDTRKTDLNSTVSFAREGVSVSNALRTDLLNSRHEQTNGSLSVNAKLAPEWQLRAQVNYDVWPDSDFDETRVELRYHDRKKFSASVDLRQDLNDGTGTEIGAGASYDFGTFLGGIEIDWTRGDGFDVLLRANTSLGPFGKDKRYIASSENLTGRGDVRGRIFLDKDMDGTFGPGDEPIENAKLSVNRRRTGPANENGMVRMENAKPAGLADITVDRTSLSDPFLTSGADLYQTVIRPTTMPFIDVPVIRTGSIDGRARFEDGAPIAGIEIQLVDQDGNVLQTTVTSFDGYYVFEYVKPGTYTVQVDPSRQVSVPPITVTVTSDDLFAYGKDLQLLEQAEEVSAAAEAEIGESSRIAQVYYAPVAEGTGQPAPLSSDGDYGTAVRQVRIGEYPDRVRLVLDLSGPAGYRILRKIDGSVMLVDLPNTAWDAQKTWRSGPDNILQNFETEALVHGGTRLKLMAGNGPFDVFYNAVLPPEQGRGDRIYIDIMRVAPDAAP